MRAEDRKPAKRVFPLLQNLDLDTVTFAQVQSVGEPISIEDMNEQELQDLVLVNLARLSVESEWTGLLEAGGGAPTQTAGAYAPITTPVTGLSTATVGPSKGNPYATRFICPDGGMSTTTDATKGSVVYVDTAAGSSTVLIGIYSTNSDNEPDALLTTSTIDTSSTGLVVTAWDTAVTLDAGEAYWMAYMRPNGQAGTVLLKGTASQNCVSIGYKDSDDSIDACTGMANSTGSHSTLPATYPVYGLAVLDIPNVGLKL